MLKTLVLSLALCFPVAAVEKAEKPEPDHVLVLPGLSLDWPLGLGIVHGLMSRGWTIDKLVTSCGAHFVNSILQAFDTIEEQRAFVLSADAFAVFSSVKINPKLDIRQGLRLRKQLNDNLKNGLIPHFFDFLVLQVPTDIRHRKLDIPFTSNKFKSIMVGARTLFDEDDVGKQRAGKKLVRMVYFGSPDSLAEVKGFTPAVAGLPGSSIDTQFETEPNWNLLRATRAGIADPYLIAPVIDDGKTYVSGAADLYPVELALHMAKSSPAAEVISVYSAPFGSDENRFFQSAFGYDGAQRRDAVRRNPNVKFIDMPTYKEDLAGSIFFPRANFSFDFKKPAVQLTIPPDIDTYRKMVAAQMDYGMKKAIEFLEQSAL